MQRSIKSEGLCRLHASEGLDFKSWVKEFDSDQAPVLHAEHQLNP